MATDIYRMMQDTQAAGERGYAQGQQRGLAKLMSQAMQAPREQRGAIVSQMAATDPQSAFDAEGYFAKQDDNARSTMGQHALAFDALPDDQKAAAYPRFAMEMQRMGLPAPPQWDPAYGPRIKQFASAWGSAAADQANTVQSRFVGEDGQVYVVMRNGEMRPLGVNADRQMWLRDFPGMAPELVGKDGQVRPVGAPQQSAPQGGNLFSGLEQIPGVQVTSGLRSPEKNASVDGVPNSYHLTGQARDIAPPNAQQAPMVRAWAAQNGMEIIDEGDHWHLEPRGNAPHVAQGARARPSEAQTAAEVEDAKQRTQLDYLPQQKAIERDSAVQQAAGVAQAMKQVDAQAELPRALDTADQTISLLKKVLSHPGLSAATGLSSKLDPRNKIPGQDAYDFNVLMDQIKGKAFLEAFTSLKGGGQITEVEGKKATDAIARINTAQSQAEFEAGVRELLGIAEKAKVRAQLAARGGSRNAPTATRRATNPKTGEVLILVNNQWVPER